MTTSQSWLTWTSISCCSWTDTIAQVIVGDVKIHSVHTSLNNSLRTEEGYY